MQSTRAGVYHKGAFYLGPSQVPKGKQHAASRGGISEISADQGKARQLLNTQDYWKGCLWRSQACAEEERRQNLCAKVACQV